MQLRFFFLLLFIFFSLLVKAQHDEILLKEAEIQLRNNNTSATLSKAKLVFDRAASNSDSVLLSKSALLLGKAFLQTGSYLVALEYLFTSLKNSQQKITQKIEAWATIGDAYFMWGGYPKSIYYYKLADSACVSAPMKAGFHKNIGDCYVQMKQLNEALIYYSKAFELVKNDPEAKLRILKKISEVNFELHQYKYALKAEFEQLEIATITGKTKVKAAILNNIGYLYNHQSNLDSALFFFIKSKETCVEIGQKDSLYITLINIGAIYNMKNDFDLSVNALKEALALVDNDSNKEKEATVRNYMAVTFMDFRKYAEALKNNSRALELAKRSHSSELLSKSYFIRSKILSKNGKIREQKIYFELYRKIRDSLNVVEILQNRRKLIADSLILSKEGTIQQLLLSKEIDYLKLRQYELLADKKEKDLRLLSQQNDLQGMALQNEILLKDRTYRLWILANKELENEKKENEISFLQQKQSEQKIKNNLNTINITKLRFENVQKKLALEKSITRLKASNQTKILIVVFFLAVLFISFFSFRFYQLKQSENQNKLHLSNLEMQQRLLRSQMNPHFLFNSLHSIQGFINSNEQTKADRFLACYAQLIRNILENTSKAEVSLEKELKALCYYIELEQMRLNNSFAYEINANGIDLENILLPPMLIQPYVENAILHGLRHREKEGLLQLNFSINTEYIYCVIRDNGIGREASNFINLKKKKEHNSVAMNLTKERLDLLNMQESKQMKVEIIDLYMANKTVEGTEVKLKIAFNELL